MNVMTSIFLYGTVYEIHDFIQPLCMAVYELNAGQPGENYDQTFKFPFSPLDVIKFQKSMGVLMINFTFVVVKTVFI